ncbi:MAG: hypothetical protein SNJ62_12355, partial [Chloracidobacterium sp.]
MTDRNVTLDTHSPPTGDHQARATRAQLASAQRLVVKIGSNVLVEPKTGLVEAALHHLVAQCRALREAGRTVVIVSSGAVACGMTQLRAPVSALAKPSGDG